jgi:biopolymer transport protein ExbD
MAGGGGGASDEATRFDLTALMDILSNIIFFLMASFGAAVVAGLPASVPTISESGENDTATEENKITLTVMVKANGQLDVSVANNQMTPEQLAPYTKKFAPVSGAPDLKGLSDHLWAIKDKFRQSKDMVLVPEDDVTYEMIVDVMDASRERHEMRNGKPFKPQMFPGVTVSSLVK